MHPWRVPGCVQILLALELKDNSKWRVPGCVQISLALELDDNSKWRVPGCVQILLALELDGKYYMEDWAGLVCGFVVSRVRGLLSGSCG